MALFAKKNRKILRRLLVGVLVATLCFAVCRAWSCYRWNQAVGGLQIQGVFIEVKDPIGATWLPHLVGQRATLLIGKFFRYSHVERISLFSDSIPRDEFYRLVTASHPRELSLANMKVLDSELKFFQRLHGLRVLDLSGTSISDVGIDELGEMCGLEELFIIDTHVSRKAVQQLRATLPNCTIYWSPPQNGGKSATGVLFRDGGLERASQQLPPRLIVVYATKRLTERYRDPFDA